MVTKNLQSSEGVSKRRKSDKRDPSRGGANPSSGRLNLRFDFGIPQLVPQWKLMFTSKFVKADIMAGITVGSVALPLSLAIALASGVPPGVGLITAVVGGSVAALFGGTPVAVTGPTATMAILIAAAGQQYGMNGLLMVGFLCGLFQVLTGFFKLGGMMRFIPLPVMGGFTAGIGAIILIGQLPRALGLEPPDQSHIVNVVLHIVDLIHETRLSSLGLALTTLMISFILPRVTPKVPAILISVLVPTLAVAIGGFQVETIGTIPDHLPAPHWIGWPSGDFLGILGTSLMAFALASIETLLSSSAADKIAPTRKHDPNQELLGQGLGNIIVSLFGGIPGTGVFARTRVNVQAGARTRLSALVHCAFLLASIYLIGPWVSHIPMAVLSGVLLSVAFRMMHPREFLHFLRSSRMDAMVYGITFITIVFVDLFMGVQAGLMVALIIAAVRLGESRTHFHILEDNKIPVLAFEGPLTFMSASKLEGIGSNLDAIDLNRGLLVDMSEVNVIDSSGADKLIELFGSLVRRNVKFAFRGVSSICEEVFEKYDNEGVITKNIVEDDREAFSLLGAEEGWAVERLKYGLKKFKRQQSDDQELLKKLGAGQKPHTLFITCADSRIVPNLITSTDPGELFIVRNVGNIIPPFGEDETPAEGAAVEFAIGVLGVEDVIVCGHSGCGVMIKLLSKLKNGAKGDSSGPALRSLDQWLEQADGVLKRLKNNSDTEQAAKINAVLQIEHLKTYPLIQEKLKEGEIRLHAWYYDIGRTVLEEWDPSQECFLDIERSEEPSSPEKGKAKVGT